MPSALASELVAPTYFTAPEYHETLGPEVGEVAELAGFAPDPEQQLILDAMFGLDKRGRHVAFEVAVICNRQNLKTGLFKQAALGKAFVLERDLFVWSAHEFSTAQEAFRDLTVLIESTPVLDSRVKRIFRGNGDEAIELKGGQRIKFKARTKAGGRGLSGDDVLLDEGFALQPEHLGALLPVLSTRPDPQVIYGSSAGLTSSGVLRGIRDRGRVGTSGRLVYVEWTDEGECADPACTHEPGTDGCRGDDPEAWAAVNPAVARGRITLQYIASERQALPPHEFFRERLGRWDDPPDKIDEAFGSGVWEQLAVNPGDRPVPEAIGLAVSIDRAFASIAAAGRLPDSRILLGAVDRRRGTRWLVDEAKRIQDEHGCAVLLDGKGPAADLIGDLEEAGVEVHVMGSADVLDACAALYDEAQLGEAAHMHDDELDAAVAGAAKRTVGDRWAWGRKASMSDVSMLEAATVAAHGVREGLGGGTFNIF